MEKACIGIIAGISIFAYVHIFNRVMTLYTPTMTYGDYLKLLVD